MIYGAYSIYDRKSLTYAPPFFAVTDGAATRIVKDGADDNRSSLARHPMDYVLYRVGRYDDQLGLFMPETPMTHVVDLVALLDKQTQAELFGLNSVEKAQ